MPVIAHIADVHIGAPFAFLPEEAAARCRATQFDALLRAVEDANNQNAAAILIAGDLLDAPETALADCARVMDILSRAHCPVLIAPGNHDYLHPKSAYYAGLPANVHVFSGTQLEPFAVDEHMVVWGAAFCDMSARIPLAAALDPEKLNVLCMHAELLEDNAYNAVHPAALAESGFDYAAFGHNHGFSGVLRAGNTVYACPGCFCGCSQKEDGARGYLLGTVEKGKAELRLVPSGGIVFETLTIDMTGICDDRSLGRAVAGRIPEVHDRACLTLELTGERAYEPDLVGLRRALQKVCVHAALRDRSARALDLWRYLENDDLRGAVTRRYRVKYENAVHEDAQNAALAALKIALAAFDGLELPRERRD